MKEYVFDMQVRIKYILYVSKKNLTSAFKNTLALFSRSYNFQCHFGGGVPYIELHLQNIISWMLGGINSWATFSFYGM